ncbi:unnamed protein product [Penicillium salamii]|nr:unnamed protein product [Penicillium salamii]CAG8270156.1 unnamed protein product [Penicillium salamii]
MHNEILEIHDEMICSSYTGGSRRSARLAQKPPGWFSEQAQQERNEEMRKQLQDKLPVRKKRKIAAGDSKSPSRKKKLPALPKPKPLNVEAFLADLDTDYTKKLAEERAKLKPTGKKQIWGPVDEPIVEREKAPNGWNDNEPDLDPDDFPAQIARCKERIRENVLPRVYEHKLEDLLKIQKAQLNLLKKTPGVSLDVARRLQSLEGQLEWLESEGDEFHLVSNLKAIEEAYKSGSLEWTHGLVTYWNQGVQLCQPRPFEWREFECLHDKYDGTKTGFQVEGFLGPEPMGQKAYVKFLPFPPDPAHHWPFFIMVKILLRTAKRDFRTPLCLELPMIDDTGASMMQIYAGDIERLMTLNPMKLVEGDYPMPRLLGVVSMALADSTVNNRLCRQMEVNLFDPATKDDMGLWESIPVSVEPGDCVSAAGTWNPRLAGPWLRWRYYTATVPNELTLGVYDYNPASTAPGLRRISDSGTPTPLAVARFGIHDIAGFPDLDGSEPNPNTICHLKAEPRGYFFTCKPPHIVNMFQCTQCTKSYQRKSHLLRHEATRKFTSLYPGSHLTMFQIHSTSPPVVLFATNHSRNLTRRHSKTCARKSNQPLPPAAKPGRKRQSCDLCFFAKASCDKVTPCSRCQSLSRQCTFSVQSSPPVSRGPTAVSRPLPNPCRATLKGSGPFSFLRHFADPSFQRDRLAIGETAKCSVRRNLETLHSHIEDALIPTDIMSTFGDFQLPSLPFQLPSSLPSFSDEYFLTQFNPDGFFPSKLSTQLSEIMTELVETSKSMGLGTTGSPSELDFAELSHLLDVSRITASITAFFQSLHWHLPVVHFPTFDPGNITSSLLLAIFLSGATYTIPVDGKGLPSALFDVAEEHIFRQIASLSTFALPKDNPTIQLIQSALIIEMLQFGRDNMQTRRRIRIVRHPCLVSTIRSLGIFHLKRETTPDLCDENTWRDLVAEGICIRIACWVFLADGFLTVCFKNHPSISVFEMNCNLPWSAGLWEAESASSFGKIATNHSTELPLPPLSDVVSQLLETPLSEGQIPWGPSVSVEHLLILIYGTFIMEVLPPIHVINRNKAINSVAFQVRAGLLKYLSLDKIRCASSNWKRVWDSVIGLLDKDRLLHLGYPKHAQELWWLLNATLEATGKDAKLRYMDNTATDDLGDLNEFIQWCYQSAPQLNGY